jgi:DNA-binding MarR family transcriptional regulator
MEQVIGAHLRRVRNPDDGRSFVLELTPAGRTAHAAAGAAFLPALDRVVEALGSDEPGVRASLRSLRAALDSSRPGA